MGRKNFNLVGDFNCIEDLRLDKADGDPESRNKGADILKNSCTTFNLTDVFRRKYPKRQEFTYISTSNQVKTRLDRFYILNNFLSRVDSVITNFNSYSDHGMISLIFKDFDTEFHQFL